jgi:hypothetical protein
LLGREVTRRLAEMAGGQRPRLLHTGADAEHLIVELGGEAALVAPLSDPQELIGSHVVVATAPVRDEVAGPLLDWLRHNPRTVLLDASGAGLAASGSIVARELPGVRPTPPWYRLLDFELLAPVRFLTALASLEPTHLSVVSLRSVARLGAEAIEELAVQGAARLAGAVPPAPAHLPAVLAFDALLPLAESVEQLQSRCAELCEPASASVQVVDAGLFHGDLAAVAVQCRAPRPLDHVRELLRRVPGLRLARRNEVFSLSDLAGEESIVSAQVKVDGEWVRGWVAADGLRQASDSIVDLVTVLTAS